MCVAYIYIYNRTSFTKVGWKLNPGINDFIPKLPISTDKKINMLPHLN